MLTFVIIPAEDIHPDGRSVRYNIARSKVPGGWIVMYNDGICFVPDPQHVWTGSSLPT